MLAGLLAPLLANRALGRIKDATTPNRLAPNVPDQARIAAGQAAGQAAGNRGRLRGGTSGLAGSEADYYVDPQGAGTVGYVRIVQELPSAPQPAAMFTPGDPGAGPEPTVLRDVTRGPVRRLSNAEGANTRTVNSAHQHVVNSTLNPVGAVTPTPKEVAAARAHGAPQGDRDALASYWSD